MTKKLTRSEKSARFDAFCSNEDNFVAIEYNDPRAVALRAKAAERNRRKQAARSKEGAKATTLASMFSIGQSVHGARGVTGEVTAIDGAIVSVNVAGTVHKFNASFLTAA